jgi:hypothetical protein
VRALGLVLGGIAYQIVCRSSGSVLGIQVRASALLSFVVGIVVARPPRHVTDSHTTHTISTHTTGAVAECEGRTLGE